MCLIWVILLLYSVASVEGNIRLQVVTVATKPVDGYERFMHSAELFHLDVEVVGMGQEWKGGDIVQYPGGGHKINLLLPVVEQLKDQNNTVVMFVDSYDVVFTAGADVILERFMDFNCRVVFSAEGFCWPDQSLATKYPKVGLGKRFLNSGGFMGYAPELYSLMSNHSVEDTADDQLYYTKLYLDQDVRDRLSIRLDHRAHIFQNLNGAKDEVALVMNANETYLKNSIYDTRAAVYHGNGPSKVYLNSLTNYVPRGWTEEAGCLICKEWQQQLPTEEDKLPYVILAIFVEVPTPFLQDVLERIYQVDYPKNRLHLWVHNSVPHHEALVRVWFDLISSDYDANSYISADDNIPESAAKSKAMKLCVDQKYDYYFTIDSLVMLDKGSLKGLMQIKRNVVAPMLVRPGKLFSNFWGAIASNGFYARSDDYQFIVENKRRGIWNVPYIAAAILMSGKWLQGLGNDLPSFSNVDLDPDMAFPQWMRTNGHFMYTSNLQDYGHLLNGENYEITHLHNDMFSIFDNKLDWERRYLHENWSKVLEDDYIIEQPCPDVYWYPMISETFANELVEEMEHFGKWSTGNNEDKRLDGGYENVPTRDIHMNQVGFEAQWLEVIKSYVAPVQLKVFPGYYTRAEAIMNFVVKYCPEGQHSLRPHHDSSTFTINVALSRPGRDFEGGGCRFLRYNCSVTTPRIGWTFMHPGRLTHYHEGLRVTKGNRYIMISFIDP